MSLYTRLIGLDAPKIPVHQFMSAMGEWESAEMTRAQVISAFGIQAGEEADLDALAVLIKPLKSSYGLHGRVTLTNVGTTYDATLDSATLPFINIQKGGTTRVEVELLVRKVGTGNQDWQLMNDNNGVEVIGFGSETSGSMRDAAAAGDHLVIAARNFDPAQVIGLAKWRLRCKSSVTADDPTYLGGSIVVYRNKLLDADVLHRILCLAEYGSAYTTEAALKTRLGV